MKAGKNSFENSQLTRPKHQSTPSGDGLATSSQAVQGGASPPISLYNRIIKAINKSKHKGLPAIEKAIGRYVFFNTYQNLRGTLKLMIKHHNNLSRNNIENEEAMWIGDGITQLYEKMHHKYFYKDTMELVWCGNLKKNTRYFKKGQKVSQASVSGFSRCQYKGFNRKTHRIETHYIDRNKIINHRVEIKYKPKDYG